ncbi:AAA family ATPase [Enterococcus sp. DIV1314a]|uniref:AAA family ATPase n=1 Tax=Enterococcus sp. DIV1314a TaxID=2774660 RepID=UPI003F273B71
MLVSFSITNFLSFKEKQDLLLALPSNRSKRQIENTIFSFRKNKRLRRVVNSSAIYGANASGKSNLIISIRSLQRVLQDSYEYSDRSDLNYVIPFLFSDENDTIDFSIEFINESLDKLYTYEISFSSEDGKVISETIEIEVINDNNEVKEKKLVFKREKNSFSYYDPALEKIIKEYRPKNFEYKSVVSMFINSINNEYFKREIESEEFKVFKEVYSFVLDKITIVSDNNSEDLIANRLRNDNDFKEELLLAFSDLDFFIKDFEVIDVTTEFLASMTSFLEDGELSDSIKKRILHEAKSQKKYSIRPIYICEENSPSLHLDMESRGTKKFISNFIEVFDALKNGEVLVFDEIEESYHQLIQKYIVNLFINEATNDNRAQLLFTTHNTKLLSDIGFAKEQIWFTEKNRETLDSYLYSLVDFKEVSVENHNWEKLYLEGRLGAVPEVFE